MSRPIQAPTFSDTTGCTLEILDENAVVRVGSGNPEEPAAAKTEQCRGLAREVAKKFYAAVRPR